MSYIPAAQCYQGRSLTASEVADGVFEVRFDRDDASTNKLDQRTVAELREAVEWLRATPVVRGVLFSSAKEVFVVGADIQEFLPRFSLAQETLIAELRGASDVFCAIEDLAVPTVAAIGGFALGGGLELALACSFRVMSETAQIGLPEAKLGLIPGAGGNVRLPRVAGAAVAVEWILGGRSYKADAALAAGVVDAVYSSDMLRSRAVQLLSAAVAGQRDWQAARRRKCDAPGLDTNSAGVYAGAGAATPDGSTAAAGAAVAIMRRCAVLDRAAAMEEELRAFGTIAKSPGASQGVQAFLDAQKARRQAQSARATIP